MFYIQASNPRFNRFVEGETCAELSAAIQDVFPMLTEHAFLVWNGIWIPLEYKYDLSILIEDILEFLDEILSYTGGNTKVCFGSDTFTANWLIEWDEIYLSILASWSSTTGGNSLVALLNAQPFIRMKKDAFLFEWKALLATLLHAVTQSGIILTDETDLRRLMDMERQIPMFGMLYDPDFKIELC